MKKLVAFVFAIIVIAVAHSVWAQTPKPLDSSATLSPNKGTRYELFQGQYTINNDGTAFKENGVFKIDTATGRTWVYREGKSGDKFYRNWQSIDN